MGRMRIILSWDRCRFIKGLKVKQRTLQEDLMTRYLLGELTEEEQSKVEEAFLSDNSYFEQLCSVEDALIDDYVQGSLTDDEREKVQGLLRSSPRQAREVYFVRDLIKDISPTADDLRPAQPPARPKSSGRLKSVLLLFGIQGSGWRLSLAALLLVAAVALPLIAWNLDLQRRIRRIKTEQEASERREQELRQQAESRQGDRDELANRLEEERTRRSQLEQELAAARGPKTPVTNNGIATLTLTIDSFTRGSAEGLPVIPVKPGTARLQIKVGLGERDEYDTYLAVIETFEGREIWRDEYRMANDNKGNALFSVPANLLSNDHYTLTLKGKAGNGDAVEVGDYSFRVKK